MKSWFAKFRISAAHDTNKPLPASLRRKIATSDRLRRFEENTAALEHALKESRPEPELPPTLHSAIMRAVQAMAPSAPQRKLMVLRWLPVPALAALLLLGFWPILHPPAPSPAPAVGPQSLATLTTALDAGEQMVRAMPSAVVAPLSDELERVNQDLDRTAQFLLASVP